jgi:hypothetical protein
VTAKPSIRDWGVLYKSGVYAQKVLCLTPGDLPCALGRRVRLKLAERRGIDVDRMGEVSRGNSSLGKGETKARTVPLEGMKRGGDPRREESRSCIRQAEIAAREGKG